MARRSHKCPAGQKWCSKHQECIWLIDFYDPTHSYCADCQRKYQNRQRKVKKFWHDYGRPPTEEDIPW